MESGDPGLNTGMGIFFISALTPSFGFSLDVRLSYLSVFHVQFVKETNGSFFPLLLCSSVCKLSKVNKYSFLSLFSVSFCLFSLLESSNPCETVTLHLQ